jgi:hypothetical protein
MRMIVARLDASLAIVITTLLHENRETPQEHGDRSLQPAYVVEPLVIVVARTTRLVHVNPLQAEEKYAAASIERCE